jgi:hypothetical protein
MERKDLLDNYKKHSSGRREGAEHENKKHQNDQNLACEISNDTGVIRPVALRDGNVERGLPGKEVLTTSMGY